MTNAKSPLVSVITPVRNGAEFIERALDSALSQTLANIEVVVVDDASSDGTSELVAQYRRRDERIKLITLDENVGPGAARNRALDVAEGEWIAVLDADDTFKPSRLEHLIRVAEDAGYDAIADNLELVDPATGASNGLAFPLESDTVIELDAMSFLRNSRPGGKVNLGWMQVVVRSEFLRNKDIRWPGTRHAEDLTFTMRLFLHEVRFGLIGDAFYEYTQRRAARTGKRSGFSRTKRSAAEQSKSLEMVISEWSGKNSDGAVLGRMKLMRPEIEVTTASLDLIDAISERRLSDAMVLMASIAKRPAALCRCLWSRYVVGRRMH